MATYFICIDTFWANSPNRFVGPFTSKNEALAEVERAISADNDVVIPGKSPLNIKDAIRICGVVSKTNALKHGMVDYEYGHDRSNVIGTRIPDNIGDLREIEEQINE
jgi:hypothetical protein